MFRRPPPCRQHIQQYVKITKQLTRPRVERDMIERRSGSDLIVQCAIARKESRGLHYTLDHPEPDPAYADDTVIERGVPARVRKRA